MNRTMVEKTLKRLRGVDLVHEYERSVDVGELAYGANRSALQAIDIDQDVSRGRAELETMVRGLIGFRRKLEALRDEASGIADEADAALRSPSDHSLDEGSGEADELCR